MFAASGTRGEAGNPSLLVQNQRPTALAVLAENIPQALKARSQWVCWDYQQRRYRGGTWKWTKVPIDPRSGGPASSTDPATWSTFEEAHAAYLGRQYDGIGFVFSPEDPFLGIDLDDAIDPATELPLPWAARLIQRLDTYCETSPSGTGVKLFAVAIKPGDRCRKAYESGEVEMYAEARFFCVTGHPSPGSAGEVRECQDAVAWVYSEVFAAKRSQPKRQPAAQLQLHLTDQNIIERASRADDGGKFSRLYGGDTSGYGSVSEATAALLLKLAFWTGKDAEQMDRLFRASSLMRPKWDEPRGETTWGAREVESAIAICSETYDPSRGNRSNGHHRHPATDSHPPEPPAEEDGGGDGPWTGYDIILGHFRAAYRPIFRRGPVLYSDTHRREVKMGEACCGAGIDLIEQLAGAADVPRERKGQIDRGALPHFFATWARSAWVDLLASLPEEEDGDEILDEARDEFRDRVSAALLSIVCLSYKPSSSSGHEAAQVQRRSLINWCQVFAKPGRWQGVRSYQLWTRLDQEAGPLRVALRTGLFSQVQGCAQLARLTQNRFTRLCEKYGVGTKDRVQGQRAVVLCDDYVQDVLATPQDDLTISQGSRAGAREGETSKRQECD
jgi:hypothetical protein